MSCRSNINFSGEPASENNSATNLTVCQFWAQTPLHFEISELDESFDFFSVWGSSVRWTFAVRVSGRKPQCASLAPPPLPRAVLALAISHRPPPPLDWIATDWGDAKRAKSRRPPLYALILLSVVSQEQSAKSRLSPLETYWNSWDTRGASPQPAPI